MDQLPSYVFIVFVGIILIRILLVKLNPPKPVPIDELPAEVRDEIERLPFAPDAVCNSKGHCEFKVQGQYDGRKTRLEVERTRAGKLLEIEFKDLAPTMLRNKAPIDPAELPDNVARIMMTIVGDEASSFQPRKAYCGRMDGESAYELEATAGPWEWEIEVTESGRLAEFEKERRPVK